MGNANRFKTITHPDAWPEYAIRNHPFVARKLSKGLTVLELLDWLVIAGYVIGMVAVGWYYARRTQNTEDYLLGGRAMRSWAVGLSLFATLLSTVSYLALPGEIIRYGPMVLTEIVAYPLIFFVVGWLIIPLFMRLRITSAYEILETRFGVSVRLLGSFIFLLLRLLWMATIVYVTSNTVLIPTLEWDERWTPLVCAALAVVTIIYTSLGGLRAVVATDVVQTFILFGGALLSLILITVHFGGFNWWPRVWQTHWPQPEWGLDTSVRLSFVGLCISGFIWYVCTAGSDQMAIQRYLATRDAPSARRVLLTSLSTGALVIILLALVGVALLAYFTDNPHLIRDGQDILGEDADKVFPRFIVYVLPSGISGLVVAAMLAAAMSSLSSGVNSCSTVITVDFIKRFRGQSSNEQAQVRLARWVSVLVGAGIVALSLYVSLVPGNIIELAYRVVNLFTVPLFILFFMALYVPWGTTFGVWAGTATSAAAAILIGYWDTFKDVPGCDLVMNWFESSWGVETVSFVWLMPAALATGIVVGPLASFIPIGPRPKPML